MKKRLPATAIALAVPVAVLAAILMWFWVLSSPAAENLPRALRPTEAQQEGWTYLVDGERALPQWSEDGYFEGLPARGDQARVEASRVVTEENRLGEYLSFMASDCAIRVSLGDTILYEDDPAGDYQGQLRTLYVNLPENQIGKTLTISSMGPVYNGYAYPCFPSVTNEKGFYAGYVGGDVRPIALSAAAAVLAVMMALLFAVGMWRGAADWRMLLLVLFALAYMMAAAVSSFAMNAHLPEETAFAFLQGIELPRRLYLDVLLVFFALYMKRRHKIILCAGVGLHVVWTCILSLHGKLWTLQAPQTAPYILLLALTLVLMLTEYQNKRLFRIILWAVVPFLSLFAASVVLALCGNKSEWVQPAHAAFFGNWLPLSLLLSRYLIFVFCIGVLADFFRQQLETRVLLRTATVQAQYAIQNAENLQDAFNRSRAARHEYRHHLETVLGLCREGDVKRVEHYVTTLFHADTEAPVPLYTQNTLVNALVSSCATRCREHEVKFTASVQVPEKLNVEDTDLAVFLTNLFDNALEGALSMPEGQRWIRLKLGIYSDIGLFVGCENSFAEGRLKENGGELLSSKAEPDHGFGLRAMRQIAKTYNSVLQIGYEDGVFKVGTCLALSNPKGK